MTVPGRTAPSGGSPSCLQPHASSPIQRLRRLWENEFSVLNYFIALFFLLSSKHFDVSTETDPNLPEDKRKIKGEGGQKIK